MVGEPREVTHARGHLEDDVAAPAAIAAVGTAPGLYGPRRIDDDPWPPSPCASTVTSSTKVMGRLWPNPNVPRHDEGVPRAVTVWAVELGKDVQPDEIKGTLELGDQACSSPRTTRHARRCGSSTTSQRSVASEAHRS